MVKFIFVQLLKKVPNLLNSKFERSNYLVQMSIMEKMFKSLFNIVETKIRALKNSLKMSIHFASLESKLNNILLQLGKNVDGKSLRICEPRGSLTQPLGVNTVGRFARYVMSPLNIKNKSF